jgi:prepilin-type N-terminal cleavage/methylation domain-containing protein
VVPNERSQRGTTLMELMMGLVILSILMAVASPGLGALVGRFYTRSAADDLMYAADLARSRARANRRAYALQVGALGVDGELLVITVRRGAGTTCESAGPGAGKGEVVFTADYGKDNATNNPDVAILRRAPAELASPDVFLCFKPDGRVVRSDTELPFTGPTVDYLAGDVFYELTRVAGTTPVGDRLQVQIGYNGSIRLVYGRDLAKLQGK